MTIIEELEILATDCEECSRESEREGNKGDERAYLSIAARIRAILRRLR